MKPQTSREYAANIEALAVEAFAKHEIVRAEPGKWLIRRPNSGEHAAEIVILGWGRILVHGDCPDVLYGRSSYRGERLVDWLATSELDYLASKVIAGEAWTWAPEVALWSIDLDIYDLHRSTVDDDGYEDLERDKRSVALREIRRNLAADGYDEHAFRQALYELSDDGDIGNPGRVPSSDVIYTREAARTLVRLLEAREQRSA